jgi:hypothetical protein
MCLVSPLDAYHLNIQTHNTTPLGIMPIDLPPSNHRTLIPLETMLPWCSPSFVSTAEHEAHGIAALPTLIPST